MFDSMVFKISYFTIILYLHDFEFITTFNIKDHIGTDKYKKNPKKKERKKRETLSKIKSYLEK